MPEGDTILKAARVLHRALAGATVTRFEPRTVPATRPIAVGHTTIVRVDAAGKHLLMRFSDGFVLRTHMRMSGAWHLYRHGERWRARSHTVRMVIETADWVAIAVNVPVIAWVRERDLARLAPIVHLGPDALADDFDIDDVIRRARVRPDATVADALLDQTVLAGVGNVFKSEILFASRCAPFALVSALTDSRLRAVFEMAREQMRANVAPGRDRRATTGRMRHDENLWVYRRAGLACRVCGGTIDMRRSGPDVRSTYWCPSCQR
jgi:endonuclease-8